VVVNTGLTVLPKFISIHGNFGSKEKVMQDDMKKLISCNLIDRAVFIRGTIFREYVNAKEKSCLKSAIHNRRERMGMGSWGYSFYFHFIPTVMNYFFLLLDFGLSRLTSLQFIQYHERCWIL
jgi:hypothetical protein